MSETVLDLVEWIPPGPGPWQQDSAHNPVAQTLLMQEMYPDGFNRGFVEAFAAYGVLLDCLAMGAVNGFTYHQPQPFDLPGPDGPRSPEWIGAEIGRRAGVAQQAFDDKIWRAAMRRWDDEVKPAASSRHDHLASVDLDELGLRAMRDHVHQCADQVREMVYQHHRFNAHALVPVGDFILHASDWTGRPPVSLFGVFEGYSPVSNVASPDVVPALDALRADSDALAVLAGAGEPDDVLGALRAKVPAVDRYVRSVGYRVLEGFDLVNPTIGENPAVIVGRLQAAMRVDPTANRARGDAFAAELRDEVPAENRAEFDELLGEARHVYRLRDERGIYSEISAIGVLRLALLELGQRFAASGQIIRTEDLLDATLAEIDALAGGSTKLADTLRDRAATRVARTAAGPPRHLGPPAPAPPSVEMLPPSLARVMSAIGFLIDGVLGQREQAGGEGNEILGIAGNGGEYEGRARLVRSIDDLLALEQGEVLVAPTTGEAFNSMLHLVGAIVTDHGSFASHAAIVSREMGFPSVVGTVDATRRIRSGALLRVDGDTGVVTIIG